MCPFFRCSYSSGRTHPYTTNLPFSPWRKTSLFLLLGQPPPRPACSRCPRPKGETGCDKEDNERPTPCVLKRSAMSASTVVAAAGCPASPSSSREVHTVRRYLVRMPNSGETFQSTSRSTLSTSTELASKGSFWSTMRSNASWISSCRSIFPPGMRTAATVRVFVLPSSSYSSCFPSCTSMVASGLWTFTTTRDTTRWTSPSELTMTTDFPFSISFTRLAAPSVALPRRISSCLSRPSAQWPMAICRSGGMASTISSYSEKATYRSVG
mmetsp:Transcript_73966/g.159959  ORF Transcript_73966/g.159959 Transcript_73966/m.159959 type:complete len:268 (-) Transcript_73966:880-1683(-)